jgi:hypothetical protein
MAEHSIGDEIPDFGGGRNLTQSSKALASLKDVLQAHDDRLAGEVNVTLSDDDPEAVGLTAASEGTGLEASRDDHVHQISAALAAKFVGAMTFTVGALDSPSTDDIVVTIQLKDLLGTNIARRVLAQLWLSDTDVSTPGTAVDTLTVTTGTPVLVQTTALKLIVESDASGVIVVKLNKSGASNRYVNCSAQGISDRSAVCAFS